VRELVGIAAWEFTNGELCISRNRPRALPVQARTSSSKITRLVPQGPEYLNRPSSAK